MRLAHRFLSNVTTAVTMTNIKIGAMCQEENLTDHPTIMIFIANFCITLANDHVHCAGVPTDHPGADPGQAQGARPLPGALGEVKFGPNLILQINYIVPNKLAYLVVQLKKEICTKC